MGKQKPNFGDNYIQQRTGNTDQYSDSHTTMPQQLRPGNTADDWYNNSIKQQGLIDVSLDASPLAMFGKLAPTMRATQSMSAETAPALRNLVQQSPQGISNLIKRKDEVTKLMSGAKRDYRFLRNYAENPQYGAGTGHTKSKDFMLAGRGADKGVRQIWGGKEVTKPSPLQIHPEFINKNNLPNTAQAVLKKDKSQDIVALGRHNQYGKPKNYVESKVDKAHEYKHTQDNRFGKIDESVVPKNDHSMPLRKDYDNDKSFARAVDQHNYTGEVSEIRARGREIQSAKNIFKQSGEQDTDAYMRMLNKIKSNAPYTDKAGMFDWSNIKNTEDGIKYYLERRKRLNGI